MLGLFQSHSLNQGLTHEQRLMVGHILELRLELREPVFSTPTCGLEGIMTAHRLLKDRNKTGVLIGGVAESVWSQQRTEAELAKHKDVDVLVLSGDQHFEQFEGGIDWWEPVDIRFDSIRTDSGTMRNITRRFWTNGHRCTLTYRIEVDPKLDPGLYILSPERTVGIRLAEAEASIDDAANMIMDDDDVNIYKRLRERLGVRSRLPSWLKKALETASIQWRQVPQITPVPLEDQRALNNGGEYRTGRRAK